MFSEDARQLNAIDKKILNDSHLSAIPTQISALEDYENLLIQRAKAFQVRMSMNPVAKKHLHNQQMVKKAKGRTFYVPLPLETTIKKFPLPEDYVNNNPELFSMVRGTPKK